MTLVLERPKAQEKHIAKRAPNGNFLKGESGNPSGRRKGFKGMAAYIRSQTRDGEELVDFSLSVFRNKSNVYTHDHQWEAMKWLADRGFGKAVNTVVDMSGEDADTELHKALEGIDLESLSSMEQELGAQLDKIMGSAKTP